MAKEIEHKYLVTSDNYKNQSVASHKIIQGYLSKDPERIVRIRIKDNKGFLTVKGKTDFDTRLEFEYEIPFEDAKRMLNLCIGIPIEKTRWIVFHEGYKWEIDEFTSPCKMVIAEIELHASHHNYNLPDFIGIEVTGNPDYYNSNIC